MNRRKFLQAICSAGALAPVAALASLLPKPKTDYVVTFTIPNFVKGPVRVYAPHTMLANSPPAPYVPVQGDLWADLSSQKLYEFHDKNWMEKKITHRG